jgi:hypothetical protein
MLTQCFNATRSKPPRPVGNSRDESVTEEYAVYNAVIEAKYREHPGSGAELMMISNRTVVYALEPKTLDETLKWASNNTPGGIPAELIENLEKQNQQDHDISDLFNLSVKGGYLLLEKKAGTWTIKRDIWMWVI